VQACVRCCCGSNLRLRACYDPADLIQTGALSQSNVADLLRACSAIAGMVCLAVLLISMSAFQGSYIYGCCGFSAKK
jgi:hypothetical protein